MIVQIHGALQPIGYALLVLFFVVRCGQDLWQFHRGKDRNTLKILYALHCKRRSHVWIGIDDGTFNIVQGITGTIMKTAGFGGTEIQYYRTRDYKGSRRQWIFESIPLWAVTPIRWTCSFHGIELHYDYECIWKIFSIISFIQPLHRFRYLPLQENQARIFRKKFLKSYAAVKWCLEGASWCLPRIIFSLFASSPPVSIQTQQQ